jgi:hypothetical protein
MSNRPIWDPSMANGCSVPEFLKTLVPDLEAMCALCKTVCDEHDKAFYEGAEGDYDGFCAANDKLYAGLVPLIGPKWAQIWYDAVRIGGWSHWGTGRSWDGRAIWARQGDQAP